MPAELQNFTFTAGDSLVLTIPVFDADGTTPLDMTGASATWQLKSDQGTMPTALIEKTTSDGITFDGAQSDGVVLITLDPADSEDLGEGRYPHAMQITDAGGSVSTVETGFCVLLAKAIVS